MDLNSSAWRNLVFEGKNKEYGAYYLRKTSSRRHLYALIIVVGVVCVSILSSLFILRTSKADGIVSGHVNLSELIAMQVVYDAQFLPPEREKPLEKEKIKQPPPKIVADEEIVEHLNQEDTQEIPETVADNSQDSVLANDQVKEVLDHSFIEEEPVSYVLGQTHDKELQSLQTALLRHVYYNVRYPDVAYKQKIKGKVTYSFVINVDGSIADITLAEGVYLFLDEEVLRVVQSMPRQEPVKKNGKPVRVKIYLPVEFTL